MSNEHRHVNEQVDDYLHDLLSEAEAAELEAHCDDCDACRAALTRARERYAMLNSLPPVEASQSLIHATLNKLDRRDERRQQVWWWGSRSVAVAATAAILVLGGLHAYYATLRPTPYDIRLLGQKQFLAGTQANLRVGLFNRNNGKPIANARVTIRLQDRRGVNSLRLASFRTGADGAHVATLDLPEWEPGRYDLQVVAEPDGQVESITRTIRLRRDWKLMLSSDKPVYQPGQTIHLRALALKQPDLKPLTGQPVEFRVEDPRGNIIFKQRTESSQFGISHTDCVLGREILEGSYQVRCRIGDVESGLTLDVYKYVLPKFKVSVDMDKTYYKPGDEARVTIKADYFFGQPAAGATVKLSAASGEQEQDPVAATLDDQGRATVRIRVPSELIGLEQESGAARWDIVIEVTDSAGQSETARKAIRVVNHPIQLAVIPAGGTLVEGVANPVLVHATYPDGRPVAARIQISGQPGELIADSLGVASFELTPASELTTLIVDAADDQGNRTRRRVELAAGQFGGDFLMLCDRGVYQGGDTIRLTLRGGGVEPVFVDVLRDGQTVLSETVDMSDGVGQLDLDLPAEIFGPLRLVAYRFNADGLAVRKSRMVFVKRAVDLRIEAKFDAESYRPGERARMRLKVTDQQGRPVPGAISLSAVDEAVFSVLRHRPGMERTFFQLENELLEPVYAIYGWSPFDNSSAPVDDTIRLEQSLFARTAHAAQGNSVVRVRFDGGATQRGPRRNRYWRPATIQAESKSAVPQPFTLATTSFPKKKSRVDRLRRLRINQIISAWLITAAAFALVGMAALAFFRPVVFVVTMVIATAGTCFLLVPAALFLRLGATTSFLGIDSEMVPTASAGGIESSDQASAKRAGPREDFPETLLWRPELITNDAAEVELDIDLADSITTWRVSASAVSAGGQLGGERFAIRVFQPFFVDLDLPVALTRHDEVAVPVVVYNYADQPQTVTVTLKSDDWFELLASISETDDADRLVRRLELQPGEVRSVYFPIKALRVGRHPLEVTASGGGVEDAVRRQVEVVPNGRRTEQVASGLLDKPFELPLQIPEDIVPGSATAVVTLYPTYFSQVVEGLDSMLRMPHGCFEQTTSATYPNVLALQYLRSSGMTSPAVELKARQYIHLGYQRLLGFEVSGGGFDWFGNPPANLVLTAYGLLEFHDMAEVYDVDPNLIQRTRDWLLAQREADGGWPLPGRSIRRVLGTGDPRLATTAYVAWAVARSSEVGAEDDATLGYLLEHEPASFDDPYTLGLVINAIVALSPDHASLEAYTARLLEMMQRDQQGNLVWWEQPEGRCTTFHGSGIAGRVEATAMATLALQEAGGDANAIRAALHWIAANKGPSGNWHSTQATVLALKCLLAGASSGDRDKPRRLQVTLDDQVVKTLTVAPDQLDVVQRVELPNLAAGTHRLRLEDLSEANAGYHVVFRYWRETSDEPAATEPLSIDIRYDRRQLRVDDVVTATATVVNQMPHWAPMVMLDLPVPPGFVAEREQLDALRATGKIARYEVTPRRIIVYLRGLPSGERLRLEYRLRATMPVKATVPEGEVYEYYNPQRRGRGGETQFVVREA